MSIGVVVRILIQRELIIHVEIKIRDLECRLLS